jgi:primosomal protein N'
MYMAYSPEMVSLLQQLRSRIFAEFGMKIRLVDPDLLQTLGSLGKKSRDPFTRKTVVKIMELGDINYDIDDTETQKNKAALASKPEQLPENSNSGQDFSTVTYRGNKVSRKKVEAPTPAKTSENLKPSKRMYRGQVVYE